MSHQTFSSTKLVRRWLDTTSAKLEPGQFQDTRSLERQTVHELVDLTPTSVHGFRRRQAEKYSGTAVVKWLNLFAAICQHVITEWDILFPKNPPAIHARRIPRAREKNSLTRSIWLSGSKNSLLAGSSSTRIFEL
ncbi:hypothetical protein [Acetobacter estunensis]|uniref:hypothetical protein n=1 Tax=Acetobacter estunensis TaxID=104097 RepID=UPI001C2DAD7F|nr:hypothetical protein [Acetobacter estunensis]MBV1837925.1 hypothetical protein [Acetobacter estunensis]